MGIIYCKILRYAKTRKRKLVISKQNRGIVQRSCFGVGLLISGLGIPVPLFRISIDLRHIFFISKHRYEHKPNYKKRLFDCLHEG